MQHFSWKIFPLLILLSCNNSGQSADDQLIVQAPKISLRAEPDEKSRELALISKGENLIDLQQVSSFEAQMTVGGHLYQTPWVKVQTPDGQIGWVMAGALQPKRKQADWLLQKRISAYFGEAQLARRNALLQNVEHPETAKALAECWMESMVLRDTFLHLLERRTERGFQPSFEWLKTVLPGFIYQRNEQENQPMLYADFNFWHQKALKTNGLEDDAFFQICLLAFPGDGIESAFPVWKFQLSETESASQLGTGQHLKMLRQIDQGLAAGPLFNAPISLLREQLLEDIFGKDVRYWQAQEKIEKELVDLIADPPKCLNTTELEALSIRLKMFEDPTGNGISVNLRSGM